MAMQSWRGCLESLAKANPSCGSGLFIINRRKVMKSIIVNMIAAAGLMVAGSAMAADMPALAKKMNCTACHAIDKKLVGPSWQDVANKNKGDATAAEKMFVKGCQGGAGAG